MASRKSLSQSDRMMLFNRADGRCEICGVGLSSGWHADHVVPFCISGRTNVHEMQALCQKCNLSKGSKMVFSLESMRDGQRRSFLKIIDRVSSGLSYTSIVLPTRYGKSDVIRMAALQLHLDEVCCGSIVLSPGGDLRNQIVRKSKIKDMCARYSIPMLLASNAHEWKRNENDPFANNVYLLSTTIQYANRNRDGIAQMIESKIVTSGLPVVVFVDETHMVSTKNEWGKSIGAFVAVGAKVVLMTATADRADGGCIPGFKYEVLETEDDTKIIRTRTGEKIKVDIYEGKRNRVRITPDEEVTFREAWNEEPSPLCTLSRDCIDVSVRQIIESIAASDDQMLSELSPSQARLVIGKAVRDERVVRKGVSMFVSELARVRELSPDVAGIIFTGHDMDSDSDANEHANLVRNLIEEMSEFECVIATSKSDDDTVSNHLARFEKGVGDVLIVKNAGGAGFDCARLKILLDLSSVRTFSSTVQRIMRVATPYGKITNAVVITLGDAIMTAIWERVVKDNGGEWADGNYDLVESTFIDPQDEPTKQSRAWVVIGSDFSSYDDNLGNSGDMTLRQEVERILDMFPIIGTTHTKPMIAEKIARATTGPVPALTIDEEVDGLQKSINSQLSKAAKRLIGDGYTPAAFQETIRSLYRDLFSESDITPSKIDAITDLEVLRKLCGAAAKIAERSGVVWH